MLKNSFFRKCLKQRTKQKRFTRLVPPYERYVFFVQERMNSEAVRELFVPNQKDWPRRRCDLSSLPLHHSQQVQKSLGEREKAVGPLRSRLANCQHTRFIQPLRIFEGRSGDRVFLMSREKVLLCAQGFTGQSLILSPWLFFRV